MDRRPQARSCLGTYPLVHTLSGTKRSVRTCLEHVKNITHGFTAVSPGAAADSSGGWNGLLGLGGYGYVDPCIISRL